MTLHPSLHAISRSSSSPATSGRPQLHLQIALRWVDRRRRCLIAFQTFGSTDPTVARCNVADCAPSLRLKSRHRYPRLPRRQSPRRARRPWLTSAHEFPHPVWEAHHHRSPCQRCDSDLNRVGITLQPTDRISTGPPARPRSLQAPDSLRLSQVQHVAPLRDRPAVSRPHRAHYPDFLHSTRPYNSGSPGRFVLLLESIDGSTSHPTCPLMLDPYNNWIR